MELYTEKDASLAPLEGKTVAILGYGNQGRAQALNLRDSGVTVIVGNRDDEYARHAEADGFGVHSIAEAASVSDIVLVLTTDESQPQVWREQIAPGIESGNTLVWASGYNVGFGVIAPPADVDVVLVAPRMVGSEVRTLFEQGKGAMAQIAVHQDASGRARETAMALAKGIGATRAGVFEAPLRVEADLDLFLEQVVWAGLAAWFELCFELWVEAGYDPELFVLETFATGEVTEIFELIRKEGFFRQMAHHSTTSQYGTLSRAPRILNAEVRATARELLERDIKGGAFVNEWSSEQAAGSETLGRLKEQAFASDLSRIMDQVIPVVLRAHQ